LKPGVSRHFHQERKIKPMLKRRTFVAAGGAAVLSACTQPIPDTPTRAATAPKVPAYPPLPEFYQAISDEPFPVAAIPEGTIAPNLWRQEARNLWPNHPRGTIVIDPDAAMLYFITSTEHATRYGVSVGAAGFSWEGCVFRGHPASDSESIRPLIPEHPATL